MQQIEQASDLHGCISTGFTTKDLQNTQVKSSVYEPGCVMLDMSFPGILYATDCMCFFSADGRPAAFSFLADHLYT